MWLRRTYSVCSHGSPTDVSLPGWQPVPGALGWPSAMFATAVCHHSGVVLLDGCHISRSNGLSKMPGTVLGRKEIGRQRKHLGSQQRGMDTLGFNSTMEHHCYGHKRDWASDLNGEMTILYGANLLFIAMWNTIWECEKVAVMER